MADPTLNSTALRDSRSNSPGFSFRTWSSVNDYVSGSVDNPEVTSCSNSLLHDVCLSAGLSAFCDVSVQTEDLPASSVQSSLIAGGDPSAASSSNLGVYDGNSSSDGLFVVPSEASVLPSQFNDRGKAILLTCFFMLYVNAPACSSVALGSAVLGEVLGLLRVVDNAANRLSLLKRFRSLFYRHFAKKSSAIERHQSLFRRRIRPVTSLALSTVNCRYRAP